MNKVSIVSLFETQTICPECNKATDTPLTTWGVCGDCVDTGCTNELEEARNKRLHGESRQSWTKRCNDILLKYGLTPDMEYCSHCSMPTEHIIMQLDDDDIDVKIPGEYIVCSRCDFRAFYGRYPD